ALYSIAPALTMQMVDGIAPFLFTLGDALALPLLDVMTTGLSVTIVLSAVMGAAIKTGYNAFKEWWRKQDYRKKEEAPQEEARMPDDMNISRMLAGKKGEVDYKQVLRRVSQVSLSSQERQEGEVSVARSSSSMFSVAEGQEFLPASELQTSATYQP